MCPSRMPTEVTTVTRIEGQRGGRGEERDDDRVDTFDEWCPRTEPVGFRFALSPSLSISSLLYLFRLAIHSQVAKPPRHGEAKKSRRELSSRLSRASTNSEIGLAKGLDGKL